MKSRRYDPTGARYMQGNSPPYPDTGEELESVLRASYWLALTATWIVIAGLSLSILMGV